MDRVSAFAGKANKLDEGEAGIRIKVKALIEAGMPGAKVEVTGDGRHFEAVVTSAAFEGKSLIQQHRMVKDTVKAQIESDELHPLSLKTRLP